MLLDLLGLIGARAWIPKVSDQPRNLHEFNTFSIGPEGIAFQFRPSFPLPSFIPLVLLYAARREH